MCFCETNDVIFDTESWFKDLLQLSWNEKYYCILNRREKLQFEYNLFLYTNTLFLKLKTMFVNEIIYILYLICFLLNLKNFGAYDFVEENIKLISYACLYNKHKRVQISYLQKRI